MAPNLPFIDQMAITAITTMFVIALVSYNDNKANNDSKGIELKKGLFNTSSTFNIGSFALMIILVALYSFFW